MQRYKAIIEYCGTNYYGMQRQSNLPTIQGKIEQALSLFMNKQSFIDFCGRTDAGVHAKGQVIHFDLEQERREYNIMQGINFYLRNEEIAILNVEKVPSDFHARFSATSRTYIYKILNRRVHSPLLLNKVMHIVADLNINAMQEAANHLIGKKTDFSAFRSSECSAENPIRTIDSIKITKIHDEIDIEIRAKSFLHNMVRIIVGTLINVGKNKYKAGYINTILDSKNRTLSGQTAAACGLYFIKAEY